MFIEKNISAFKQAEALLRDSILKIRLDPKKIEDLKVIKILQAREENNEFEMELAEMICGDNENFPYRSSFYLTKFFKDLGFNYQHDGTTRRFWVRDVLLELDISEISFIIEKGLFRKKDFINSAKNKNVNPEELQKNAIQNFKDFIDVSIRSNETIDLHAVLDLNVNIELLFDKKATTTDTELNKLIQEAKDRFLSPDDKHIALEKLWDAFERIKTYFLKDKKKSTEQLINLIQGEIEVDIFENEFRILTSIGNNYRIRHHEKEKREIKENKNLNYLFFRMLSLIDLCLSNIQQLDDK